jgi:hypothetical protein
MTSTVLLCGCGKENEEHKQYKQAKRAFKEGNYAAAGFMYNKLGDYKNSAELYEESTFLMGEQYFRKADFVLAEKQFSKLKGRFKDSVIRMMDDEGVKMFQSFLIHFNTPVPKTFREFYFSLCDTSGTKSFGLGWQGSYKQVSALLGLMGDHKEVKGWSHRLKELSVIPVLNEKSFIKQVKTAGNAPQPRTIVVIGSEDRSEDDNWKARSSKNNPFYANMYCAVFCEDMKCDTRGNLFFTMDATQACAIIRHKLAYRFLQSASYDNGSSIDYYTSTITVELCATDGKVLCRESLSSKPKIETDVSIYHDSVIKGSFSGDEISALRKKILEALEKHLVDSHD